MRSLLSTYQMLLFFFSMSDAKLLCHLFKRYCPQGVPLHFSLPVYMYVGWCRTWMEVPRTSLPTRGNPFQRRDHLALSSLRFASCASSERSEGSLAGQRSFAALRMTILKGLRLTRKTSYINSV